MAPHLKMIYFPLQGRGEIIRFLCQIGGVPLDEEVVEMSDWPAKKPSNLIGCY